MSVFMEKNGGWEGNGHLAGGQFYSYRPEGLLSLAPFVHVSISISCTPQCRVVGVNQDALGDEYQVHSTVTIFDKFAKRGGYCRKEFESESF